MVPMPKENLAINKMAGMESAAVPGGAEIKAIICTEVNIISKS